MVGILSLNLVTLIVDKGCSVRFDRREGLGPAEEPSETSAFKHSFFYVLSLVTRV